MFEEKRNFRRYTRKSACEIKVNTDLYTGRLIDYSASGARATFKNAPLLAEGIEGKFTIFDSDIEFNGRVVWINKTEQETLIGLERTDKLSGSLKDFHIADILIGLQKTTKTGILGVENGTIVKRIYIKNGDMFFATSSNQDDRLGEMLLKDGKITFEQYMKASELIKNSNERLGRILVRLGLTPKDVFNGVKKQIEGIILSIFTLQEGGFVFNEGPLPSEELISLHISAANLIYRGIKGVTSFHILKQACPPLESVLAFSQNPRNAFQDVTINEQDKKLLSNVDGSSPLNKILTLSPLNNFETLKTLCSFLSIGLIRVKKEQEAGVRIPFEKIIDEPVEEITKEFLEKVEYLYSSIKSLGYYEILEVDRQATSEEITGAYYRLSKQFHPDRHFSIPSHDIKEKLIMILDCITEAYDVLSDQEGRAEYDSNLSHFTPDTEETYDINEKEGEAAILEEAGTLSSVAAGSASAGMDDYISPAEEDTPSGMTQTPPDEDPLSGEDEQPPEKVFDLDDEDIPSDMAQAPPDEDPLSGEDEQPPEKVFDLDEDLELSDIGQLKSKVDEIFRDEGKAEPDEEETVTTEKEPGPSDPLESADTEHAGIKSPFEVDETAQENEEPPEGGSLEEIFAQPEEDLVSDEPEVPGQEAQDPENPEVPEESWQDDLEIEEAKAPVSEKLQEEIEIPAPYPETADSVSEVENIKAEAAGPPEDEAGHEEEGKISHEKSALNEPDEEPAETIPGETGGKAKRKLAIPLAIAAVLILAVTVFIGKNFLAKSDTTQTSAKPASQVYSSQRERYAAITPVTDSLSLPSFRGDVLNAVLNEVRDQK
jgi:curved DNA-binding protein CbpA